MTGATAKKERGRSGHSEARKLVTRLESRRTEVLRSMMDFQVSFNNNQAERDLRMVRVQQKVSGCFRIGDGARQLRGLV